MLVVLVLLVLRLLESKFPKAVLLQQILASAGQDMQQTQAAQIHEREITVYNRRNCLSRELKETLSSFNKRTFKKER